LSTISESENAAYDLLIFLTSKASGLAFALSSTRQPSLKIVCHSTEITFIVISYHCQWMMTEVFWLIPLSLEALLVR